MLALSIVGLNAETTEGAASAPAGDLQASTSAGCTSSTAGLELETERRTEARMTTGQLIALIAAAAALWGLLLRAYRRGHL
jgi:hypothetical protein